MVAEELRGVDLALVDGTGPNGRVTEADVMRFHEQSPPAPKMTALAAEMIRQAGLDGASHPGQWRARQNQQGGCGAGSGIAKTT